MSSSFSDNPSNNLILQNVEPLIRELVTHLKIVFSSGTDIMDENEQFERKKIANKIKFEKGMIELLIEKIKETWPEGKTIYQEFQAMNKTLNDLMQNAFEWSEFINQPDFSIFIPKTKEKYENYVLNNRRLAAKSDSHIFKADKLLKKSLGIDLMEMFNE